MATPDARGDAASVDASPPTCGVSRKYVFQEIGLFGSVEHTVHGSLLSVGNWDGNGVACTKFIGECDAPEFVDAAELERAFTTPAVLRAFEEDVVWYGNPSSSSETYGLAITRDDGETLNIGLVCAPDDEVCLPRELHEIRNLLQRMREEVYDVGPRCRRPQGS